MKANLEVELKPFIVPNNVIIEPKKGYGDQSEASTIIPLIGLDPRTLDKLCEEFRDAVFKKAGKQQPPTAA